MSDDELVEDNLREKGVPTNLIKVVTEAMCPNVKKRIQTVRDFKNQLSSDAVPSVAESKRAENEEQNFTADEETIVGSQAVKDNSDSDNTDSKRLLAQKYSETFDVPLREALNYILAHGMSETQRVIDSMATERFARSSEEQKNTNSEPKTEDVEAWRKRDSFRPFSFKGRIGRLQLILSYVVGLAWFAIYALSEPALEYNSNIFLLFLACTAVFFWFLYAQCAKRCHDLGKSGAWMFVPFWNVLLFFAEGEKQDNQYGQGTATGSDHSGNNILWIIFWIVVPIGIVFLWSWFGNSTSGEIYDVATSDSVYDSTCVDSTLTDSAYADSTACAYNDAPYYPQP